MNVGNGGNERQFDKQCPWALKWHKQTNPIHGFKSKELDQKYYGNLLFVGVQKR